MQICITGVNGFIGNQLVETFSAKGGYSIRILTRQHKSIFPPNIEVVIGDLTKVDCPLSRFLKDCEVLINCAGEVRDVKRMASLHIDGTQRLIQAVINEYSNKKRKIHWVQLSSCGIYGPPIGKPEADRVVTETTAYNPVNVYESTKTKSDELVIHACDSDMMTFSILRPTNVIGAKLSNHSLFILINIVKRGMFFYLGKVGSVTNYVHVEDVAEALLILATDPRAKGEVYNLSSDCTLEELINKIASLLNVQKPNTRIPGPVVRIPLSVLSTLLKRFIHIPKLDALVKRTRYPTTKIETDLGFVFSMPMPEAIKDLTKKLV